MPILRERKVWKREKPAGDRKPGMRLDHLTPEQEANVRAAVNVLRIRLGSLQAIAKAIGVQADVIEYAMRQRGRPTAGLAVHAARLAVGDGLTECTTPRVAHDR